MRKPQTIDTKDIAPLVNFDELDTDIVESLPSLDETFCCCALIDSSIGAHEHLDDCELTWLAGDTHRATSEEHSDTSSSTSVQPIDAHGVDLKRRHRESMARLRHKLRTSIASLEKQERKLELILRHTVERHVSKPHNQPVSAKEQLRAAYVEQVREHLALLDERNHLEVAQEQRDKYQRLLRRELERTRTFQVRPPQ